MVKLNRYVLGAAATGLILASAPGHATNGYFAHGYGTKNNAMAGAGVALPQDALAAATNPAGMVWVGSRKDLGVALFNPNRQFTEVVDTGGPTFPIGSASGTGSPVESDETLFLVPHFGGNWMLDDMSSFGISVYGNGGMNTKYRASDTGGGAGVFASSDAGVDLSQLFIAPTYAKKLSEDSSWGISAIIAYQRFEAIGLSSFGGAGYSSDSTKLSNNGYDDSFGIGARIGFQTSLTPTTTLGISYQTAIDMDEFSKYAGLFAEQGDFDIPPTATIGLAWKTSDKSTLALDVQWIGYSEVASIANPISPNIGTSQLGNDDGAGFGWDDMTIIKVGYQWQTSPEWTWRVGFSAGDQPIPSTQVLFNILAPGVMEEHITFGFTWAYANGKEFNFAAMHALESSVTGTDPVMGSTIELQMDQWQLEASWGWTF